MWNQAGFEIYRNNLFFRNQIFFVLFFEMIKIGYLLAGNLLLVWCFCQILLCCLFLILLWSLWCFFGFHFVLRNYGRFLYYVDFFNIFSFWNLFLDSRMLFEVLIFNWLYIHYFSISLLNLSYNLVAWVDFTSSNSLFFFNCFIVPADIKFCFFSARL